MRPEDQEDAQAALRPGVACRRRFSLNVFVVTEAYPTFREDRQMLLYVQTWLPLLMVTLTAAIFFGVASLMMAHPRT